MGTIGMAYTARIPIPGRVAMELRTIPIGGHKIAYRQVGAGPPIVLLHGVLSDSRYWTPQFDELARDFTVIAWDAPGAGSSTDPPETFSIADYAHVLAEFVRALGIERAHIGGLSWGGALALELYRHHPDMVRSLMLADTYAGWKGSLPAEVVYARLEQCLQESELAPAEFIPNWLPGLLAPSAPAKLVEQTTAMMSDFHPAGYRAIIRGMAEADERDVLPSIRVPTLLVWGEGDKRSPTSVAGEMRNAIRGARLVVIPGAGHLSSAERPDRFNAAVRAFCNQNPL